MLALSVVDRRSIVIEDLVFSLGDKGWSGAAAFHIPHWLRQFLHLHLLVFPSAFIFGMSLDFLHDDLEIAFLEVRDSSRGRHLEEHGANPISGDHFEEQLDVEIPAFFPDQIFVTMDEHLNPLLDPDLDVAVELVVDLLDVGQHEDELLVEFLSGGGHDRDYIDKIMLRLFTR